MTKSIDAKVLLIATVAQAIVPALGLLGYFLFLRMSRPHVTDIHAGFILPYRSGGVIRYVAEQDWTVIHGLEAWLGVAVLFGLACHWRAGKHFATRMVRASRPARADGSADNTTIPAS